jgi:hypothetical protein
MKNRGIARAGSLMLTILLITTVLIIIVQSMLAMSTYFVLLAHEREAFESSIKENG